MLNVTYTFATIYIQRGTGENRYELIDSYLRLTGELARLCESGKAWAGQGNTVSLGQQRRPRVVRVAMMNPGIYLYGSFRQSKPRACSICISWPSLAMAVGKNGFYNSQFFLNNKLIDERHLDAANVRLEASRFP